MANFLDKYFGRLGNRMFQTAFFYSFSRDNDVDFYFQDPKWFERYDREIKYYFSEGIGHLDRVGVHVRRGDYVGNNFYTDLCKTGYYDRAMDKFKDKFLVFSDDIDWCKNFFSGKKVEFSEGRSEEEDLKLMASCKHQIIANSSFSWWAAYLNPNPDKIVIAPKDWYADGVERTVCPKEWIKL